jgi:hypothetical protein
MQVFCVKLGGEREMTKRKASSFWLLATGLKVEQVESFSTFWPEASN